MTIPDDLVIDMQVVLTIYGAMVFPSRLTTKAVCRSLPQLITRHGFSSFCAARPRRTDKFASPPIPFHIVQKPVRVHTALLVTRVETLLSAVIWIVDYTSFFGMVGSLSRVKRSKQRDMGFRPGWAAREEGL